MHSKNITRLMLDIVLTILFISLIYPRETGFQFHEIAGLGIAVLFLVHIALNWSWCKSITKNIFNPRLKSKPKLFYLLDCISFITVAGIITTGIMISQVLFPSQDTISHTVVLLHKWISYSGLVLFGLHIALHWRFIVETMPRLFRDPARPVWAKTAMSAGAIVLILGLLFSQIAASNTEDSTSTNGPLAADNIPVASTAAAGRTDPYNASTSTTTGALPSSTSLSSQNTNISPSSTNTSQAAQNSSITSGASSGNTGDQITLNNYLGKMFCTGCEKHCSLLALRCDRGLSYLEAAKQKYQTTYASAALN